MLFELETVALAGRKRLYDLLKKNLQAAGVSLTPSLFARHGLKSTPEQSVASLAENAGSGKGDVEKIGEDVRSAYARDLLQKAEVNAAALKLFETAAKKGFHLGALSILAEDEATAVIQKLGLKAEVKLLAQKPAETAFPNADTWIRLLKVVSGSSQPAVAVVSTQTACKSALAAGMRVIALPDEFTAHQDFGGADFIVDDPKDLVASEILPILLDE